MICRLCLTETEFCLPLKNVENREKGEETVDIAGIIRKHFDLELDINSDLVCTVCWQQISEFHTFYLFIEEKQKEFSQQSPLPALDGTGNDATPTTTDNEHEMFMENEVAAKDGNGNIKIECLVDLNAPIVKENSFKQWDKEATPKEVTENLVIKSEFIDEVNIEASNCELSAMPTDTDSEYEIYMIDDDEVDIKNESLIEVSNSIITENSLNKWNKQTTPQEATENLTIVPSSCEIIINDIAESTQTLNAGSFKCELCAQTLEDFAHLKQHFKKEHRRRGYVTCCNKRYYYIYTYAEHLKWHSNPNIWKCEPCNRVYSSARSFDDHIFRVHPKPGSVKLQCKFCPIKFPKPYLLLEHVRDQHSTKDYKCDECNKELKNLRNLKQHKRQFHLRVYAVECDRCGKTLSNRTQYEIHKAKVHGLIESPKKLAFEGQHNAHNEDIHSKQKFKKNTCVKEFKILNGLKQHKTLSNRHAKDTECDICGKVFASSTICKIHKANLHQVAECLFVSNFE